MHQAITPSHRVRTLWLCGVLHGFTHLYMVALLPLYLLIQKDLGLETVDQATLLMSAMMFAYFGPSYPMGVLADRVSRKGLLGVGLAINALGFVGLSFSPDYATALASVIVAGLGGSLYHPAATALVVQLYPVNTGRALGLVGVGSSAGFFIAPLYAGWRAGQAGWRAPVLELGLTGIVAAGLFFWLAEESPRGESHEVEVGERKVLGQAVWLAFLVSAFFFSLRDFGGSAVGSLGSLFLQQAHGMDTAATGAALSAVYLAGIVGNPLFGHLSDRGRGRWTTLVLAVAGLIALAIPRVPRVWVVPLLLAYGFFCLSSYPMVEAALMVAVPDTVRGRVFGLFITVGGLVGNLGHWCSGLWVHRMGESANQPQRYFGIYLGLALLIWLSVAGLPFLKVARTVPARGGPVLRRREHKPASPS